MTTLDTSIFKAYDIRAIYPTQVNSEVAYALGQAYTKLINPKTVVVGNDVRTTGPELKAALINGLTDAGVNVVDIGNISTEMLYFTVGHMGYDGGIVVTASHNPAEYNGFKMVKKNAEPITGEAGIYEMRDMMPELLAMSLKAEVKGSVEQKDVFEEYKKYVLSYINVSKIKPMKVVMNGNFGYQGQFAKRVLAELPIELVEINCEPDGTFPKGRPDPFVPENRDEFLQLIRDEKPDFGVAWDADADRVFFATGDGEFIEGYFMSALLSELLLKKQPGSSIVYDVRYTWAIIDAVKRAGGVPVKSKVGHSYIKKSMRENNALFCGEASGHCYIRDFFYADSGMIPFLWVLELLSTTDMTLREHVQPYLDKYFVSGEINTRAENPDAIIAGIKAKYADATEIDETDRLTIEYGREWRCNIRTSNTEPLFRLNVEATTPELMAEKRDELVALIAELSKS